MTQSTALIDKLAWVFIMDRKVLFVRSKDKRAYFFPGGKREEGESDIEALSREVREELSVELIPNSITYLEKFTAQAFGKPEGVLVQATCYTADFVGTLTPAHEIEELAWFTSVDAPRTSATGELLLIWLKQKDLID